MFLNAPSGVPHNVQQIALVLNTVLLIAALIVFELVYAERPKAKRQGLKYLIPIFVVLVGLLAVAAYKQLGAS